MPPLTGDPAADAYLAVLGARARELLGDDLVGAYLLNSGARGDYRPGRSDLDVALVVDDALDDERKARVAEAFRHRTLPCPAPRLELVTYRAAVARNPGSRPDFELNLNTGTAIDDHVSFNPAEEPWFWFVLDLGAAADAALAIDGAVPDGVFGRPPRAAVVAGLRASLAWHAEHDVAAPNRVLNACRSWCWVVTGQWRSKTAAARWAIEAGGDRSVIEHAAALREGSRTDPLDPDRVRAFGRQVASVVENGGAAGGGG
jgi:hypothetical protein